MVFHCPTILWCSKLCFYWQNGIRWQRKEMKVLSQISYHSLERKHFRASFSFNSWYFIGKCSVLLVPLISWRLFFLWIGMCPKSFFCCNSKQMLCVLEVHQTIPDESQFGRNKTWIIFVALDFCWNRNCRNAWAGLWGK